MAVARTNLMVVARTKIKCSYSPNPAYFDLATIPQWTIPCSVRNELFELLWLAARFKKLVDYGRTWVTTIRHKRCFQKQTNHTSVFLLGILHTSCSPLSRKTMKKVLRMIWFLSTLAQNLVRHFVTGSYVSMSVHDHVSLYISGTIRHTKLIFVQMMCS